MSAKTNAWLAGVAGVSAVAAVAGVSTARSVGRRRTDDPYLGENFDLLASDRGGVIMTDDGVPLAVREVGPANAPLTVVFVHGFCLEMASFHFQRAELAQRWGDSVRMVFYDQRGHGRSGHPRRKAAPSSSSAMIWNRFCGFLCHAAMRCSSDIRWAA